MNGPADYLDAEHSVPQRYAVMKAYLLREIDTVLGETWHEPSEMQAARAIQRILSDNNLVEICRFELTSLSNNIEHIRTALFYLQELLGSPEQLVLSEGGGVAEEAVSPEEIASFREVVEIANETVRLMERLFEEE